METVGQETSTETTRGLVESSKRGAWNSETYPDSGRIDGKPSQPPQSLQTSARSKHGDLVFRNKHHRFD